MNHPAHPADPDRLVASAAASLRSGDARQALQVALKALQIKRGHPGAAQIAAAALNYQRNHNEARDLLSTFRSQMDRNPGLMYEWAYALVHAGHPDEAMPQIDALDRMAPGRVEIAVLRGVAHAIAGRHEKAIELLSPLVEIGPPHAVIHRLANSLRRVGRSPEAIDLLTRTLENPSLPLPVRRTMLFARADIYDGVGEYDRAWADLAEARQSESGNGYDPDAVSKAVDDAIMAWSSDRIAALHLGDRPRPRGLFVVGMWRSGTTLVQQVLSSHPSVASAGELNTFQFATGQIWPDTRVGGVPFVGDPARIDPAVLHAAGAAHARTLNQTSLDATFVIDKLPVNMLYLGLIGLACPGTRVIKCVRDPIDTCLSCMFQLRGALAPYCDRPDWLGRFYRDAARLDDHWSRVLDMPRLEIRYEEHVGDAPGHARRMCEFLALKWDERMLRHESQKKVAMTRSIDQVRLPVYRSAVARWRNYEKHLGPLIEAIGVPARGQ